MKIFPQELTGIECDIFYNADKYKYDWREKEDNFHDWKDDVAENVINSFKRIAVHFYNLGYEEAKNGR
jgi:hypothetical protein